MRRTGGIAIALLLLAGSVQALDYAEIAPKIRDYDYGDSRLDLTWVENLVQWSLRHPHERAKLADMLTGILASDATHAGKQFACRQLAIIGGADQVPALVALLQDPATADIARYALERIPAPQVDRALLEVLERATGDTAVGIINTLGERGTVEAIRPLSARVNGGDAAAEAAIAALGRMTDRRAIRALAKAKPAPDQAPRVAHALLAQADALAKAGDTRAALRLYTKLTHDPPSDSILRAARLGCYRLGDAATREELLEGLSAEEQAQLRDYVAARSH